MVLPAAPHRRDTKMSLAKKIFGVGIWTGASRLLGFARDMLIGRYLGAGRLSDIFVAAFKLPNLFRDLLGEGALSSVFIPMFAKEKKSTSFASNALSWLVVVLLIITALMEIFMPLVMLGLAPGFDAAKLSLTIEIGRIMFAYVILVCVFGFMCAVLNAFSDFILAAALPILLNVFLIAALILFGADLHALALAVLAAGITQIAVIFGRLSRKGFGIRLVYPKWTPAMKSMIRRMGWGLLGSGFYQLNIFVGMLLASYQSGAVSWLYYSDRMVQLPFAIVGLAAGTVILTKLSDALNAGKTDAAHRYQNAALRQSMMLVLPCAAGLFALAPPIIKLLFQHGEWTAEATASVALAIMIQVFALPFMTTSQIYLKTLYASGDAKTPVKVGAVALGLGAAVMVLAAPQFGYLCVPIGTVSSGLVRNLWLRGVCVRRGLYRTDGRTVLSVASFWLLSILAAIGMFFARPLVTSLASLALVLVLVPIIYLPLAIVCDKMITKKT